ncbi:hypothetical protein BVRB_4g088940 [Beta vulgaris subsp. vulgaris]|nr:hypothetical protein BVRB_4g088940 [Beta vulgaris subsp. vulgaris]
MREKVLERDPLAPKENQGHDIYTNPKNFPNSISPPSSKPVNHFSASRKSFKRLLVSISLLVSYFWSIYCELSTFPPNQFKDPGYKLAKSWQLAYLTTNPFIFSGYQPDFINKASQFNYNWVKGFGFPPLLSAFVGFHRVVWPTSLMVSERCLCFSLECCQFRVGLGGFVFSLANPLNWVKGKRASLGVNYLLFSASAFNVMEFITLLPEERGAGLHHSLVPKSYLRISQKSSSKLSAAGLLPTPISKGVIINEAGKTGPQVPKKLPEIHGKGKGKMRISQVLHSDDSSDDEAPFLQPLVSSPAGPAVGKIVGATGLAPLILPNPPIQVFSPSDLFDDNQFSALTPTENPSEAGYFGTMADDETFCINEQDDDSGSGLHPLTETSFHSLHSDNSIIKELGRMGVDATHPVELSSQSGSIKRRIEDKEDEDDASSALKRKRN